MIVTGTFRLRKAAIVLVHAAFPSVTKTVIRPIVQKLSNTCCGALTNTRSEQQTSPNFESVSSCGRKQKSFLVIAKVGRIVQEVIWSKKFVGPCQGLSHSTVKNIVLEIPHLCPMSIANFCRHRTV